MIGRLSGICAEQLGEKVIVDVNGVGYEVAVVSLGGGSFTVGAPLTLTIYTHVREDAILLYGFRSPMDREIFLMLIGVSGVGPKLAATVMSQLPVLDLVQSIERDDTAPLNSISGIGLKSAKRIILELKTKVSKMSWAQLELARHSSGPAGTISDAALALVSLGYRRPHVDKALSNLTVEDGASTEWVIKEALKKLGSVQL